MKLLFAIVQNSDAKKVTRALVDNEINVTWFSSSGGFLQGGNTTLMIGIEDDRVKDALDLIKANSKRRKELIVMPSAWASYVEGMPEPIEVTVGGATVFIVNVEAQHKF